MPHAGLPGAPAGAGVQNPSAIAPSARLQTSQLPAHGVSQQIPSAQFRVGQRAAESQALPTR